MEGDSKMILKDDFLNDIKAMLGTDEEFDLDTDLLDVEAWDSLSAMGFIAMVEEKYGVKLEPFSIAEAVLFEDLYNIVVKEMQKNKE